MSSLLNPTQPWKPWNFLNAPRGSTVAFTASICLYARPGMREAADRRQPAAATPPCIIYLYYILVLYMSITAGAGAASARQKPAKWRRNINTYVMTIEPVPTTGYRVAQYSCFSSRSSSNSSSSSSRTDSRSSRLPGIY